MIPEYESKLDDVFTTAFEINHPAMLAYVEMKMELKRLRDMDYIKSDGERYRTALEQYANPDNWQNVAHDGDLKRLFGKPTSNGWAIASEALKEK